MKQNAASSQAISLKQGKTPVLRFVLTPEFLMATCVLWASGIFYPAKAQSNLSQVDAVGCISQTTDQWGNSQLTNGCSMAVNLRWCSSGGGGMAGSCDNFTKNKGFGGSDASLGPGQSYPANVGQGTAKWAACYAPDEIQAWTSAFGHFVCMSPNYQKNGQQGNSGADPLAALMKQPNAGASTDPLTDLMNDPNKGEPADSLANLMVEQQAAAAAQQAQRAAQAAQQAAAQQAAQVAARQAAAYQAAQQTAPPDDAGNGLGSALGVLGTIAGARTRAPSALAGATRSAMPDTTAVCAQLRAQCGKVMASGSCTMAEAVQWSGGYMTFCH